LDEVLRENPVPDLVVGDFATCGLTGVTSPDASDAITPHTEALNYLNTTPATCHDLQAPQFSGELSSNDRLDNGKTYVAGISCIAILMIFDLHPRHGLTDGPMNLVFPREVIT